MTGIECSPSAWFSASIAKDFIATNDGAETCQSSFSCINCTASLLCQRLYNGTYLKLGEFNCSAVAPYCDFTTGSCTTKLPADYCAPIDPTFICSGDGYYPNPNDCRKYYSCIKGVAYTLDCNNGLYYDSRSETCQNPHPCYTFDCSGQDGIRIPYAGNFAYYGVCINGNVLVLNKCPGNFEFDVSIQDCTPVCNQPGRQGDPFNCTSYYKCSYGQTNDNLSLTHFDCPQGEMYDALNSQCIPLQSGEDCNSDVTNLENYQYVDKLLYPDVL